MEIDNKDYKEVKIKKMIVDGKEQAGNIIYAEATKDKQELHVTIYTQEVEAQEVEAQEVEAQDIDAQDTLTVQKMGRGRKLIYELLQKSIFHNRRN